LRFGGDWTPQVSSDKVTQDPQGRMMVVNYPFIRST